MEFTLRKAYGGLFLFTLAMLGASLFLEFQLHMQPCVLCQLARGMVVLLAFNYGLGLLTYSKALMNKIIIINGMLFSLLGLIATLRHVWLLQLPAEKAPACIPSIEYLLKILPLKDVIWSVLKGGGECIKDQPSLGGVSLPTWTLIGFIILLAANIWLKKKGRQATLHSLH